MRLLLHCALLLIISVFVLETISHLVHSPIEVRSSWVTSAFRTFQVQDIIKKMMAMMIETAGLGISFTMYRVAKESRVPWLLLWLPLMSHMKINVKQNPPCTARAPSEPRWQSSIFYKGRVRKARRSETTYSPEGTLSAMRVTTKHVVVSSPSA